jgi:hypothetical protein
MENSTQMTKENAIQIIQHVASVFNGNLKDHQTVQEAIQLITKELFKEEKEKEHIKKE